MANPAYIRFRLKDNDLAGPLTVFDEKNLWEIHEFEHEISATEHFTPSGRSRWNARHKVVRVALEVSRLVPELLAVDTDNFEYLDRVELFWLQSSGTGKKSFFYFKHALYPVKITATRIFMPNVKDPEFERYNHLATLELRYRWIEHFYTDGNLQTKAEWIHFFANECIDEVPEEFMSARTLSDDAADWEKQQDDDDREITFSFTCIDLDGNAVPEQKFQITDGDAAPVTKKTADDGTITITTKKKNASKVQIVYVPVVAEDEAEDGPGNDAEGDQDETSGTAPDAGAESDDESTEDQDNEPSGDSEEESDDSFEHDTGEDAGAYIAYYMDQDSAGTDDSTGAGKTFYA